MDGDNEMDDDDFEEDADETMEHEEGDGAASASPHPAVLPGAIPPTDCLFCPHHSHSLLKNLAHMTKVHSFFLPDLEFLINLKGLICYLGEWKSISVIKSSIVLPRVAEYLYTVSLLDGLCTLVGKHVFFYNHILPRENNL